MAQTMTGMTHDLLSKTAVFHVVAVFSAEETRRVPSVFVVSRWLPSVRLPMNCCPVSYHGPFVLVELAGRSLMSRALTSALMGSRLSAMHTRRTLLVVVVSVVPRLSDGSCVSRVASCDSASVCFVVLRSSCVPLAARGSRIAARMMTFIVLASNWHRLRVALTNRRMVRFRDVFILGGEFQISHETICSRDSEVKAVFGEVAIFH